MRKFVLEWKVRFFSFLTFELFYNIFNYRKDGEEMRDEKRTLECLKKGVRIASQCLDTGVQVQLYVELLNHYLFYFERGNSLITVAMLNQVSQSVRKIC